jgi:acetylornithine deacetylase/succinyl-diaminopimelate desuccinylase-like protein
MTSTVLTQIDTYIEEHIEETIAELARLCAQPSISAQGLGIVECAHLVGDMLTKRGLITEIISTAGNPVVVAHASGASRRTLLFYNHYDVQPPDPLELWTSPPFELTRRDGTLVARGVSDDKGEFISRLAALDAVRAVTGDLPCGVKFLVEGEEEVGSPNLAPFIEQHTEHLRADACIWEFGLLNYQGAPVQYLGVRGLCYVELAIQTATKDAHSGLFGSIFPNAAWRLTWALSTLKRADEHIRIPGFYDDVAPPSERDLELLAALPDEAEQYRTMYGISHFLKDLSGVELRREEVFAPTCTICGLTAGYQGPGSKTVLPARASAKIDFRLVPNQDPQDIVAKLRAHLDAEGFSDIEVTVLGSLYPARTDPDHPFIELVRRTAPDVYDQPMQVWPMIGGSGPNYYFTHHLKLPIANVCVSHPGSQFHAPNENIRIDDLLRAIKHVARIILGMGVNT